MQRKFQDLCLTCNNTSSCVQLIHKRQPVFHCELFDDYIPSPAVIEINTVEPSSKQLHEKLESNRNNKGSVKGLCQNCEKQNNCFFTDLEEEVWQCEEYV